MSGKLRDSKGRILPVNVYQRADGQYEYRYFDEAGVRRSVYSWKLHKKDKTPKGKKDKPCIDDLIIQIKKDLDDGISTVDSNITVYQLCTMYLETKNNVSENTRAGYKTVMNTLKKHPFSQKKIRDVRIITAKVFLIGLQKDYGKSYSTIHNIRGVLRPAFKMACADDLIRKNPFDFELVDVLVNDCHRREAISIENMKKFLKFVKADDHFCVYYDAFYILFYTGLRISEFCGLTLSDIDLEKKTLVVDHQLQRARDGRLYVIDKLTLKETTKTKAGVRTIPIEDEVVEAFRRIIQRRNAPTVEPMVDGHVGFLCLNENVRKGVRPYVAMDWEHIFTHAVEKYNSIYRVRMPKITPHVCRHTYCTMMAKKGVYPPMLQFLMGHSDISITMNYYTHLKTQDAREELERVNSSKSGDERIMKMDAVGQPWHK